LWLQQIVCCRLCMNGFGCFNEEQNTHQGKIIEKERNTSNAPCESLVNSVKSSMLSSRLSSRARKSRRTWPNFKGMSMLGDMQRCGVPQISLNTLPLYCTTFNLLQPLSPQTSELIWAFDTNLCHCSLMPKNLFSISHNSTRFIIMLAFDVLFVLCTIYHRINVCIRQNRVRKWFARLKN